MDKLEEEWTNFNVEMISPLIPLVSDKCDAMSLPCNKCPNTILCDKIGLISDDIEGKFNNSKDELDLSICSRSYKDSDGDFDGILFEIEKATQKLKWHCSHRGCEECEAEHLCKELDRYAIEAYETFQEMNKNF